jgi:hypothetical protein
MKNKNGNNISVNKDHHQRLPLITKKKLILLMLLLIVIIISYSAIMMKKSIDSKSLNSEFSNITKENFLDGCRYVYIDMGTNIGIQIRKIYEPHLYPQAPILPIFKQIFANYSNEVCSVGFEANPIHDNYLKQFENYCLQRHWRVKIFTSTAVSITQQNLTFYVEPGNEMNNQWGASLDAGNKKTNITVLSIDIVSWIKNFVLTRKIPSGLPSPKIVMKSDIEGHDSVVIANFVLSGVFCSIDLIYGEHFNKEFQNAVSLLQKYSDLCKTKLIYMDDETYYTHKFPFTN